jgi:hypothetical protein
MIMITSVGMKSKKKQPASQKSSVVPDSDREFEQALLMLENACLKILDGMQTVKRGDTDGRYWQQRFENFVTPVSLALAECKGPRRFHYHYRRREDGETVLQPVLEPKPIDMLAMVCRSTLKHLQEDLAGLQIEEMIENRFMLEEALQSYLLQHRILTRKLKQ